MELIKIVDLIDQPVSHLRIDLRERNESGEMTYDLGDEPNPIVANLKSVEIRHQKISHKDDHKSAWLYWTWEINGLNSPYSCGYSGTANKERWGNICFEVVDN